jgi:RNA polymerase sigma-70 factor (ECF subfamily)
MSEPGPIDTRTEPVTRLESPEVVRVLVENHRRFLAFLERRVGSREVAEDILQDAFVRGIASSAALRDESSVVAWFYRSLRNALIDHWRHRAAEQRAMDRAGQMTDNTVPAVDEELMDTVCACAGALLDTLNPPYAEALRRVDLGGASVSAYAAEAGITPNNASVRLFRGRQALLKQVKRSCGTCADHGCLDCTCGQPKGAGR